jgi:hypothetical protein
VLNLLIGVMTIWLITCAIWVQMFGERCCNLQHLSTMIVPLTREENSFVFCKIHTS